MWGSGKGGSEKWIGYNAVNDMEKTILSVINQTYTNIEWFFIDGGSIDATKVMENKYLMIE